MVLSEKVAETLKEVLDYPLQGSQNAFVYAEVVTGELVYEGMGEFRDAITHISRALWIADEEEALRNLDEAFEHIRRAGVESIEWAAARQFEYVKRIIQTPSFIFRLIFFKRKSEVLEIERQIRRLLLEGREKKSRKDKWVEAILDYKKAIEKTDKLYEMCPSKLEYRYRIFMVVTGLATLAALAINVYLLFGTV